MDMVASQSMSERLDRVLEHNPAIVYTCTVGRLWTFSYISPNVRRILGYDANELLKDPDLWRSRIHPDDRARVPERAAVGLLVEDNRVWEYRFRHRNGTYLWVRDEVRLLPERDPVRDPFECSGYCIDITTRKSVEEALQESEARFAAFMRNSPAVAFMKDEDGRWLYVNPAYLKIAGLEGVDWQGKTDFDLWPPAVARQWRATDLEILSTGVAKAVEEVIPGRNGNRVLFMLKFVFRDPSGRVYLAGMGIDSTERRMLEERFVRGSGRGGTPPMGEAIGGPLLELPVGTETILLVEDEDLVRDLANRVLSQQGFRVIAAANGDEALALFEQADGRCDLVVTDVVMPGLGGREVVEKLRASRPQLKAVFISGYHDTSIFDPAEMRGQHKMVYKPFSPHELLRAVRTVLDTGPA